MSLFGVVCICSRGLIHSRTVAAVYDNLANVDTDWVLELTHNLPIPDCQNIVVQQALEKQPSWLWFVEEDMVPASTTLGSLLQVADQSQVQIVSAKYKLRGGSKAYQPNGKGLLYSGLGCLLVSADVFKCLPKPWFRSDVAYDQSLSQTGKHQHQYGGQDIHFFAQLKREGITAKLADVYCPHAILEEVGKVTTNNGFHKIRLL